jgi:hypothetical protein
VLPKDKAGRLYFELEYKWIQPILDTYEIAYACELYTNNDNQSINLEDIIDRYVQSKYLAKMQTSFGIISYNAHIVQFDVSFDWLSTTNLKEQLLPHLTQFLHLNQTPTTRIVLRPTDLETSNIKLFIAKSDENEVFCCLLKTAHPNVNGGDDSFRFFGLADYLTMAFHEQTTIDPREITMTHSITEGISIIPMTHKLSRYYFIISTSRQCCKVPGALFHNKSPHLSFKCRNFITLTVELQPVTNIHSTSKPMTPEFTQQPWFLPPTIKQDVHSRLESFSTMLIHSHQLIKNHKAELESHLKLKYIEASFMLSLLETHSLSQCDGQNRLQPTGYIKIDELPPMIHHRYDIIAEYASPSQQQYFTDEVVWFNVRGESVCLLKSTILEVIPNSQLAMRLGGKWKEQQSTLDDEGRIIVVS